MNYFNPKALTLLLFGTALGGSLGNAWIGLMITSFIVIALDTVFDIVETSR